MISKLLESLKNDLIIKLLLFAGCVSIIVNTVSAENDDVLKYSYIEGLSLFVSALVILFTQSQNSFEHSKKMEMISRLQYNLNSANVIRDSKQINLDFSQIVFGDLVVLREGMEIPADGILIEGYDILVDESSMTGESDQISKNLYRECMEIYKNRAKHNQNLGDHEIPSPLLLAGFFFLKKKNKN